MAFTDKIALKSGFTPGYCVICGKATIFRINQPNFRENVLCWNCRSFNRQRQVAVLLLNLLNYGKLPFFPSVRDIPKELVVWNAEVTRALHERLSLHLGKNYISSEYIDPAMQSGQIKDGILHIDMQNTHFQDSTLDIVLSCDVMEHMPDPMRALNEIYRILKPGGHYIFTVPFYRHRFTIEKRAELGEDGSERYLLPPLYHDGSFGSKVLVYNIFAPELLCNLEEVGFKPRLFLLRSLFYGILGDNGVVIAGTKPAKI